MDCHMWGALEWGRPRDVVDIKRIIVDSAFRNRPILSFLGGKKAVLSMLKIEEGLTKWLFICPACHDVFDIGQTLRNE